ncbi:MAG TPA: nucleoside-diphosphate sugar epimerase/dehydratase [Pyrinomonadaceae bacterium]|nr:nucleoside-diphosphate sugar epimerase/dehydratase [Pyrinomonadaceae bacterium]
METKSGKWWVLPTKKHQRALDLIALSTALIFSYLLRFDLTIPTEELPNLALQLPYVVLIQYLLLRYAGVYAFIWRYISLAETKAFLSWIIISAVPLTLLRFFLPAAAQNFRVPLSIIMIDAMLAFGGIVGMRVLRRILYEQFVSRRHAMNSNGHKAVLLIGAGRAGRMTAREILQSDETVQQIKGFVDDDPNKQGAVILGIKVLGPVSELPRLVNELEIDHVIISIAKASRADFRRILDVCDRIPVKVRIIPNLNEILQGRLKLSRIREVQVEDLLGREPVQLDEDGMRRLYSGKTIIVTGAGGSIGSELARQIATFSPARLILVERAEFALFNVQRELERFWPNLLLVPLVADVGDKSRMRLIFDRYKPNIVIHAAAHKHVPMMEWNISEAVKNNVLATRLVGELAGEFDAEAFVFISTDKAVRPSSIMGASKRMAELAIQNLNWHFKTRYVAVRFGNVIGSAGSVIPIFREQISRGGPVTVTHRDMTRYFMTIPEASQLVLQAGALGEGGEIFVLDMGEPVRIFDLAKDTIILSGLKPFEDIDIVFTGVRPGEKLFEELEMDEEHMSKTQHPKIFIGKIAVYPDAQVQFALGRLKQLASRGADAELRTFLNDFLPEAQITHSALKVGEQSAPLVTPAAIAARAV